MEEVLFLTTRLYDSAFAEFNRAGFVLRLFRPFAHRWRQRCLAVGPGTYFVAPCRSGLAIIALLDAVECEIVRILLVGK